MSEVRVKAGMMMHKFDARKKRIDWLHNKYGEPSRSSVDEFVRAINETYYRHWARSYHSRYIADIERHFKLMVDDIALSTRTDINIIDIGGGTGFEYDQLIRSGITWNNYYFIEPDGEMIRQFLREHELTKKCVQICHGDFSKFSSDLQCLPNKVIILNSTLHHIVWPSRLLNALKQCMNKGDLLLINHEPNNKYFMSFFMFVNYSIRCLTSDLLPRKLGILKTNNDRETAQRWYRINQDLIENKVIRAYLKPLAIRRIIDYGVGTSGDWKLLHIPKEFDEGHWNVDDLIAELGPAFKAIYLKTYRHFGDPARNPLIRFLNLLVERLISPGGSVFSLAVLKQ